MNLKKRKIIFAIAGAFTFILFLIFVIEIVNSNERVNGSRIVLDLNEFNQCLAREGMIIYGIDTCVYCQQVVDLLGGKDLVKDIYVDCMKETKRCKEEMFGGGVPEIQINKRVYNGPRTLESFSKATGCSLN